MRITIILLLSIKVALFEYNSTNNTNTGLIANGEIYNRDDYPYVVSIQINKPKNMMETCTGTLVKELYVLTAAHCAYGIKKETIEVYHGSYRNNRDYRKVVELHLHKKYDPASLIIAGDLCVLKIEKPFPNVKEYIKIGGTPKDFTNHKVQKCTLVGFGRMNNEGAMGDIGYMMKTDVKHGETDCEGYQSEQIRHTWEQYLCSAPSKTMACQGDSGGPMICNGLLYGVCSFFINYKGGPQECGSKDMQTVHIFINYYLKWVNNLIEPGKPKPTETTVIPGESTKEPNEKEKKKKKKKKKKKSAGNSILPDYALCTIIALTWSFNLN